MTDTEFREEVIDRLARVEEGIGELRRDKEGHISLRNLTLSGVLAVIAGAFAGHMH